MNTSRVGPVSVAWAASTDRRAAGRDLLRRLVADLGGGADATIGQRCDECGAADHGALYVVDRPIAVSVSYADPLVVVAAVRHEDAASVGIDVEPDDRPIGDLAALFAPNAAPDLTVWTRIEAVLKATGRGIRMDPSTVRIDGDRTISPPGFEVATMAGPEGHIVSVAVAAASTAGR